MNRARPSARPSGPALAASVRRQREEDHGHASISTPTPLAAPAARRPFRPLSGCRYRMERLERPGDGRAGRVRRRGNPAALRLQGRALPADAARHQWRRRRIADGRLLLYRHAEPRHRCHDHDHVPADLGPRRRAERPDPQARRQQYRRLWQLQHAALHAVGPGQRHARGAFGRQRHDRLDRARPDPLRPGQRPGISDLHARGSERQAGAALLVSLLPRRLSRHVLERRSRSDLRVPVGRRVDGCLLFDEPGAGVGLSIYPGPAILSRYGDLARPELWPSPRSGRLLRHQRDEPAHRERHL